VVVVGARVVVVGARVPEGVEMEVDASPTRETDIGAPGGLDARNPTFTMNARLAMNSTTMTIRCPTPSGY
jgi:hypothetical protein